jgi:hypothetical protein
MKKKKICKKQTNFKHLHPFQFYFPIKQNQQHSTTVLWQSVEEKNSSSSKHDK